MNAWNEEQHPRNVDGEFTHASIGAWAKAAAEQLGDLARRRSGQQQHPPGWVAAAVAHEELWAVPSDLGRDRTDAEQQELEGLEKAFDTYRQHLGLQPRGLSGLLYQDGSGGTYTEHGEYLGHNLSQDPPPALRMGFQRVGEHPTGFGSAWGSAEDYGSRSTHPQAGGLWIDPARPGTRHDPIYLNDLGHGVSDLRKGMHPSVRRKLDIAERRRGGDRIYAASRTVGHDGSDVQYYVHSGLSPRGLMNEREGTFGYGARGEAAAEHAGVFVAAMKRAKRRASVEGSARRAKRRTPRGTVVEGWMDQASRQLDQRMGRG